jgi:AraC-like DNA-binding protein
MQLSTRRVAIADRADYWGQAKRFVLNAQCRVVPQGSGPLDAAVGMMQCGNIRLIDLVGTPYRSERMGPGESGAVLLMFQLAGVGTLSDRRRTARLNAGDVCVVPPDRDIVVDRPITFRQVLVSLKTEDLDEGVPRWRELEAVTVPGLQPGVRATLDLVRYALAYRDVLGPACRERLAATALGLFGRVLGDAGAGGVDVPGGTSSRVAASHRQRVERFIHDNLRDPELSVAKIARELGVSTRYLHKLYEKEPAHLMQQVLVKRLSECRREIRAHGGRSITDIAYAWGFNSPAHFSRAFKKQFGVCPSDS